LFIKISGIIGSDMSFNPYRIKKSAEHISDLRIKMQIKCNMNIYV